MMAAASPTPEQSDPPATRRLVGPDATAVLAARLAPHVAAGDVLLLAGPIGAGKTHFARALIGALLDAAGAPAEDVPSPSYTLVQIYHAGALEIWHADLYRLSHPDELDELGLEAAFGHALCLVEWPERMSDLAPGDALTLHFGICDDDDARVLSLIPHGPRGAALARALSPGPNENA